MHATTLVPFGLLEETGEWVDVHGVPRGAACGCICPSCRTPLVAKQSEGDRVWHFAHESRGTDEKTRAQCQYSLYVALKLMSRRLFRSATQVRLPQLSVVRPLQHNPLVRVLREEADVSIAEVEIEARLAGMVVDVAIAIEGRRGRSRVGFYLSHPGHSFPGLPPNGQAELEAERSGLIEIRLEEVWADVLANSPSRQYREALLATITSKVVGKSWRFHPLETRAIQELEREILRLEGRRRARPASVELRESPRQQHLKKAIDSVLVEFGCRSCRIRFAVIQVSNEINCPKCRRTAERIGLGSYQTFGSQNDRPWNPEC